MAVLLLETLQKATKARLDPAPYRIRNVVRIFEHHPEIIEDHHNIILDKKLK